MRLGRLVVAVVLAVVVAFSATVSAETCHEMSWLVDTASFYYNVVASFFGGGDDPYGLAIWWYGGPVCLGSGVVY